MLVTLAACVGTDPSPSDRLTGTTWVGQSSSSSCVFRFTFEDDGESYEIDQLCALTSGRIGMEGEQGHYDVEGTDIVFHPETATCPSWSDQPTMATFELLDGDRMQFSVPQGEFVSQQAAGGEGTGGTLGCFDDAGLWMDAEWQAV